MTISSSLLFILNCGAQKSVGHKEMYIKSVGFSRFIFGTLAYTEITEKGTKQSPDPSLLKGDYLICYVRMWRSFYSRKLCKSRKERGKCRQRYKESGINKHYCSFHNVSEM